MKRLSIIINVIVISALVILAGGGVTLVHCNHTGNTSVAQLAVAKVVMQGDGNDGGSSARCCGMEADGDCCHCTHASLGELPCMDYTLVSGQPTNYTGGASFDFQPLYTLIPEFLSGVEISLPRVVTDSLLPECYGRHGPPRSYLRLITVLQI